MTLICSIHGCGGKQRAKGYCHLHYARFYKHGDPLLVRRKNHKPGEVQEYFYSTVLPYEGDDCLVWPYARTSGYGMMTTDDGKRVLVSRYLCEQTNGPPPTPKHEAAHSCGNGHLGCATKGHLSWKTRTENRADRIIHGTHNRGEKNHTAKISEDQAREIFSLRGKEMQRDTAARLGIKKSIVADIQTGRSWGWLNAQSGVAQ